MSHYDYTESQRIEGERYPFYALVMAAMRQADSSNLAALRRAFPATWAELDARYHAPGGIIGWGEVEPPTTGEKRDG